MIGTTLVTKNANLPANVYPGATDSNGYILSGIFDTLSTPPAGSTYANFFQKGCILIKTDAAGGIGALYQNTGTLAIPAWTLMPISGTGSDPLTNAHIFVGNASNIATDVAMSGDITISNTGVTAIGANKVLTAMILNANVTLAKLAAGITPSHVVKFAGTSPAYGGGGTSVAISVTGALATDVATAVIRASTNAVSIVKAVLTTDTLTITFSADPGAATTVDYSVLRAAA